MGLMVFKLVKGVCFLIVVVPLALMFLPFALLGGAWVGLMALLLFAAEKVGAGNDTDWIWEFFMFFWPVVLFIGGLLLISD